MGALRRIVLPSSMLSPATAQGKPDGGDNNKNTDKISNVDCINIVVTIVVNNNIVVMLLVLMLVIMMMNVTLSVK